MYQFPHVFKGLPITYCWDCGIHLSKKCGDCRKDADGFWRKQWEAFGEWKASRQKLIHKPRLRCKSQSRPWTGFAMALVAKAIRRGILESVKGKRCIDCGRPARVYDHRYYSRPLEVQAVCWSCNNRRGHAWDEELLRAGF